MNPLTNMKNVLKLSERELGNSSKSSWHDQYKHSAWIFVGGFPFDLTEGDVIAIFSQYGEIVNINLVRDKDTGKSKGFAFLCYEDQRSTVLAVDNFNGIKILGRTIRVDHVNDYKMPKNAKKTSTNDGCPPKDVKVEIPQVEPIVVPPQDIRETLVDQIKKEIKLPMRLPIYTQEGSNMSTISETISVTEPNIKKEKKHKKKKSKKSSKRKSHHSSDNSNSLSDDDVTRKHKKKKK